MLEVRLSSPTKQVFKSNQLILFLFSAIKKILHLAVSKYEVTVSTYDRFL